MPILNYTTKIAPERSLMQIQKILSKSGAISVRTDYENGRVMAVVFALKVEGINVPYRLPANVDGVLEAMKKARLGRRFETRDHAEAVAWRIIKDWIEAQLALVEAKQAQLAEVFLPYAVVYSGQTMFEVFQMQATRLLSAGVVDDEEE